MRFAVLLFAAVLAGCASTTPQSRGELKTFASAHPKFYLSGTYTANRRLEDVASTLQRKWDECYSVQRTTTRTQGGMTTMRYRDTFQPGVQKVSNSLVEMTLRMSTQGMVMLNTPQGGEYIVALDLERLPGNKTRLSWYSSSFGSWPKSWERNKQWAEGKNVACEGD